jgi:hypothetical protein
MVRGVRRKKQFGANSDQGVNATQAGLKEAVVMDDRTERQFRRSGRGRQRRKTTLLGVAVAAALVAAAATTPAIAQPRGPAERAGERADDRVDSVASYLEAYVSDEALQVQYARELRIEGFGPTELRGGVFYNEQRDLIGMVDALLYIGDQANRRQIEVNVGTRLYGAFLNAENEDTFAVGLGGEAQYFFGRDQRTSLKLTAFYGPDILTFGIADNIQDVGLRLQTRIRPDTDLFVGYRSLEIETILGRRDVDDHVNIGFRRTF